MRGFCLNAGKLELRIMMRMNVTPDRRYRFRFSFLVLGMSDICRNTTTVQMSMVP
jgi:hypothetical protein